MGALRASALNQPLVFVDIETNGLSHVRGRVIEVAAIRVEQGAVVREFSSLVDPESALPDFITSLTGITAAKLKQAPTFHQIADELEAVLAGAVFVAHNARFDYSYLKQEFKRLGRRFLPKQLCTVKLSRALFPHERRHGLAELIARYDLHYRERHRAYDDAHAIWQFIQYIDQQMPAEQVTAAVRQQLRQPALPRHLSPDIIRDLPEGPGVYIFEDEAGQPLYVGKSVTIKRRVLSHFERDHAEAREFQMAQTVRQVRTIETAGELGALLLEARLVKELRPLYNRQLRRHETLLLVRAQPDAAGYLTLTLEETAADVITPSAAAILAVYPSRSRARTALRETAKTFDLCSRLMGLEKGRGGCFAHQLHKCRGACAGHEPAAAYNQRLLAAFERQRVQDWPYPGPVLIEERASDEKRYGVVVDRWCVLGELHQEPACEPDFRPASGMFDLDVYNILHAHFTRYGRQLACRLLDARQLAAYTSTPVI